jgi:hypothetical protein
MPRLVEMIRNTPGCTVQPPSGTPSVGDGFIIPEDLAAFYRLCGGATLFEDSAYGLSIVPPDRVVVANPVILVGVGEDQLAAAADDPSWSRHIIAEGDSGMYVTIDLAPDRLGLCYDSHWDVYPADSETIALSFTDLLARLLASGGGEWYWGEPDFELEE